MRGVAAMSVFFFHLDIFLPGTPLLTKLFSQGFKGVYIFFVVSGFIMAHTTAIATSQKLDATTNFIGKRLIRIIPLYYVATAIVIVLLKAVPRYFSERPDLLIKSLAFIPTFEPGRAPNYGEPPLFVGWTLNYEILFYALFAIAILFGKKRDIALYCFFAFFVIFLPLMVLHTVTLNVTGYEFQSNALKFLSNPILLYFIAGVLLAKLSHITLTHKIGWSLFAGSLILFLVTYFVGTPLTDFLFITLLVASASILAVYGETRLSKAFIYLGDISYSIYLFHMIVIFAVRGFFNKFGLAPTTSVWIIQVICFIVTLIVSAISYELIERRVTYFLRTRLLSKSRV